MSVFGGDGLIEPGFFSGDDSWGGQQTDRAQNAAIRTLRGQVNDERRRLKSELRSIRGSMEQRLDRMAASFDAFVELSDVREQLVAFAGAAMVRRRVLAVLDGADPAPDLLRRPGAGTEGYWLVPAAHGLADLLSGDLGGAQRHLSEAADLDAERAGTFALLAAALRAPEAAPAPAEWILPGLMPEPPEHLAAHQYALLLLAAEGRLGEGPRDRLLTGGRLLLREATGGSAADAPEALLAPLLSGSQGPPREPTGLSGTGPVRQALEAGSRLARLRTVIEGHAERTGDDGAAPSSPALAAAAPVLRLLVEEGSPEEAPLLHRAGQLRSVVESGGGTADDVEPRSWNDAAGVTLDLLMGSAFSARSALGTRRFALDLFAPVVRDGARALEERATVPLPELVTARERGVEVAVGASGPDPSSLRTARERLSAQGDDSEVRGVLIQAAMAGASFLACMVAAAAMSSPLLWVLTVITGLGAGWLVWRLAEARAALRTGREYTLSSLERKALSAARSWAKYRSHAEQTQARAREDAEAIERVLGAGR
ncbi:hypothetical protein [Nocardiopsis baichengensis]|uniref:hypothetical protein n=1 Tax=Nocardiopsis baichengensis TaxID=280240 RepID=UPI00034A7EA7|nr:hypothetical protein [Nocardiopsis baichengensis]